jgi:hypothetical protein
VQEDRRFINGAGGDGAGEKQFVLKSNLAANWYYNCFSQEFGSALRSISKMMCNTMPNSSGDQL